MPDTEGY